MDETPNGFASWLDAMEAIVRARAANKDPNDVGEHVWEAFVTVAFVFMPKISQ